MCGCVWWWRGGGVKPASQFPREVKTLHCDISSIMFCHTLFCPNGYLRCTDNGNELCHMISSSKTPQFSDFPPISKTIVFIITVFYSYRYLRSSIIYNGTDKSNWWCNLHQSAIALKLLTCEINNIHHLVTMQCTAGKPWALTFNWMLLSNGTPRQYPPSNTAKLLSKHDRAHFIQLPHSLDTSLIEYVWNVTTSPVNKAPASNPKDPKDPLLMF